jgi:hypothetical protein
MVNSLSNIIWILSYPAVHPIYQTFPMQNQKKKNQYIQNLNIKIGPIINQLQCILSRTLK